MTSWMVKSVELFWSMSEKAASRKPWTRCSARERAAVRLRETARCRQSASEAASSVTTATVPSPRAPALLEGLDSGPVGVGGPQPGEGVDGVGLEVRADRLCG